MVSYTPIRMAEFKSAYGPKYAILLHPIYDASIVERLRLTSELYQSQPNLAGFTIQSATRIGTRLAFYGAPAVVGVLLFANGIPRVQRDILQKIPVLGDYFRTEIHPADNPF
ncbi:hypothetical protein N0V84_011926 [Fusarium piperis]|uniref:Uncharacterized protein n=1 Tax=Fusarium piperis TaxID=1435070 RepID=A0A9W8TB76_9HYPO|nr:hypothetical protein N0V84_011926 [Fusarium piperis]